MARPARTAKVAETKTVNTKIAETKTAEVKPAEKKAAPVKEAEKKEETVVKKAAAPKKEAAKKAEPQASVVIQYAGKEIVAKDVLAATTGSFQAANKGVEIKTIEIYVKPEENVAYYVVNGKGSDDYKVEL